VSRYPGQCVSAGGSVSEIVADVILGTQTVSLRERLEKRRLGEQNGGNSVVPSPDR